MTLANTGFFLKNTVHYLLGLSVLLAVLSTNVSAQQQAPSSDPTGVTVAPVIIDGKKLFRVRGLPASPATKRASKIRQHIIVLANDPSFDVDQLTISTQDDNRTIVMAGDLELFNVWDEDAELEAVKRELLAYVYRDLVADTIVAYRIDRSTVKLLNNTLLALVATTFFRNGKMYLAPLFPSRIKPGFAETA